MERGIAMGNCYKDALVMLIISVLVLISVVILFSVYRQNGVISEYLWWMMLIMGIVTPVFYAISISISIVNLLPKSLKADKRRLLKISISIFLVLLWAFVPTYGAATLLLLAVINIPFYKDVIWRDIRILPAVPLVSYLPSFFMTGYVIGESPWKKMMELLSGR